MSDVHGQKGRDRFDLSIMYSRECDLMCPHCMYDSSPMVEDRLDLEALRRFIATWDDRINSVGLYGGEVTIHLKPYTQIVDMLPQHLQRWMISNGAWSTFRPLAEAVIRWTQLHRVSPIIVSGTQYHRPHQNRELLEELAFIHEGHIWLKGEEDRYLPMGRLKDQPFLCTQRCRKDERPTRIAVQPDGSVIFQTCDGVYPVIGHIDEGFAALAKKTEDYPRMCPNAYSTPIYSMAQVDD